MKGTDTSGQYSKIDQNTSLNGTIKAKTDIRVDGKVEGKVETTGKVILGKEAKVLGEIRCVNADIEGIFKGKLMVSGILNLKSTANVEGEVLTQKLIVEAGATFNAQCKMHSAEEGVKKLTETHEKTA
ncbi:polymer-forming cytoskeletal protein [Flavobacteriaceae bacterium]|jgi:cytoskeletal protein CcmA (bactofilin family)|nr:polymer-forming cytoskeletal protein [Flavobacteriaceae bacterium]MDA9843242.1 polymer-forming cytoskeletal protein [Flavobacteriaceae bacterium]MDA9879580.1 polymer-forming cytoskeletal protein [Flavobacteriaceae bacterium]